VPRLSVLAVRAALLYLAVGATLGALILWDKGLPLAPGLRRLLPAHREMLLMGWMVQLALGVGVWILPRFSGGGPRRRAGLAWAAVVLLNLGILLTGFAGPLGLPLQAVAAGRALELAAALLFVVHLWPRVRAFSA
jgi:hypothetical protein